MNDTDFKALKELQYPSPFPRTTTYKSIKEMMVKIQEGSDKEQFRKGFNNQYKEWNEKEQGKSTFAKKYAKPFVENFEKKNDNPKMFSIDSEQGSIQYLPTKEDCDKAIKELHYEDHKGSTEEVLDRIEKNATSQEFILKKNWRIITKENMKNWRD